MALLGEGHRSSYCIQTHRCRWERVALGEGGAVDDIAIPLLSSHLFVVNVIFEVDDIDGYT